MLKPYGFEYDNETTTEFRKLPNMVWFYNSLMAFRKVKPGQTGQTGQTEKNEELKKILKDKYFCQEVQSLKEVEEMNKWLSTTHNDK